MRWDPEQYLRFGDARGRPFADLMARVPAPAPDEGPDLVVDLGCGPGNLTRTLAERWPDAEVVGVDSSVEMVERAIADRDVDGPRLRFEVADLREWEPGRPVDVLTSNATLQWVPGHLELLPRLVASVRPGGYLAFSLTSLSRAHTRRSRRPTCRRWSRWGAPRTCGRRRTCRCSRAPMPSCRG